MKVTVLRLGHRFCRDARLSTHLALTARAFGADEIVFDVRDPDVWESVSEVNSSWGGGFAVKSSDDWRAYVRGFDGEIIHLTMYGLPLTDAIPKIDRSRKDKLVIVGGAKVPADVYEMVDYNIAVGSQPHSEVAALSVFLDRLFGGSELVKDFKGKKKIIPQARGKKVEER